MRVIPVILLLATASASGLECGRYQIEDFGDRVVYSLVDYNTYSVQGITYRIENPTSPTVRRMVSSLCYCVDGQVSTDPKYPDDGLFRILNIEKIISGPTEGCGSTSRP